MNAIQVYAVLGKNLNKKKLLALDGPCAKFYFIEKVFCEESIVIARGEVTGGQGVAKLT